MTNRFMVSAAALALLAGTGFANAQSTNREPGGATGGSTMQHSSPGSTSGAASGSSESKSGMTTGQSSEGATKHPTPFADGAAFTGPACLRPPRHP